MLVPGFTASLNTMYCIVPRIRTYTLPTTNPGTATISQSGMWPYFASLSGSDVTVTTPQTSDIGVYTITLTVSDGMGNSNNF